MQSSLICETTTSQKAITQMVKNLNLSLAGTANNNFIWSAQSQGPVQGDCQISNNQEQCREYIPSNWSDNLCNILTSAYYKSS